MKTPFTFEHDRRFLAPEDSAGGEAREGRHCRSCEYYDECDHTGKNCRRNGHGEESREHGEGEHEHGRHGFRGEDGHGHEHGFRDEEGRGHEHGFRDEEGRGHEHGFHDEEGRGHGPHGGHGPRHAHRPEFLADGSLRSLLIRAAQTMHHPRAGASQELVLRILSRGDMDQMALRGEMRIQPGSLSELLGKLEQKGLIERERAENDRRRVTVRLTEAGRAALTPGETAADDPFAVLTEEEQATLRALLGKLLPEDE